MGVFCDSRLEPVVDAFRMKQVPANRDLLHKNAVLELFKAYDTLILFEFVKSLVVMSLWYQTKQLFHPFFLRLLLVLFSLSHPQLLLHMLFN